jgi:hypothetical protein
VCMGEPDGTENGNAVIRFHSSYLMFYCSSERFKSNLNKLTDAEMRFGKLVP